MCRDNQGKSKLAIVSNPVDRNIKNKAIEYATTRKQQMSRTKYDAKRQY